MKFDELSNKVIGCALKVHRELGPGLLESTYEQCLCYELSQVGINFERQKELPVKYQNVMIDCGYRIDLLVEGKLIVELKSVDTLQRIHEAQLLTYMKLAQIGIGLLINFNSVLLRDGIKRLVRD
jgi:GxxExxY protein